MRHFKNSSFKPYFLTALFFAILAGSLVFINIINAWTNPASAPPAGSGAVSYSGGNVGIGAASPGEKLEIGGGGTTGIKINEFKIKRISATEMGVYDSTSTAALIFDEGTI